MITPYAVPSDDSPLSKAAARAWTWAHSKASGRGVKLVVLAERPPSARRRTGEVAVFTLASTRPSFTTFAGFLAASREMGIMDVLAMDDDVPKPVLAAVKAAGWSKVLDHQVCGFWFGPADEIPTQQPQWMPTGAVVPPQGAASRSGELAHCHLVLVPVDGWWHPLRYGAIWTWVATAGIARGETWRFVPEQEEGGRWGQATLRFDQFVYVSPAIAAQAFEMPDRFLRDDDVIVTLKEAGQTSS